MQKFEEQARSMQNIHLDLDRVQSLGREGDLFVAQTATGRTHRARSVILAQGKRRRKLGVEGEERYFGRGLSVCATCDGPLFRDKVVVVIGGGNSALQTAIEMSRIAREVHLVVRSEIKADPTYVKRYEGRKNIVTYLGHTVTALHGNGMLSGITIRDNKSGEEKTITVDGVFAEIGWIPNTDLLEGLVPLNDQKEVIIDIDCNTGTSGVFAAGDVTNIRTKQIITAAGEGAKAALAAYAYLNR